MPHTCTTCYHPDLDQIDRALLANEPLRRIGARFGLAPSSLYRHKKHHLMQEAGRDESAAVLEGRVENLEQRVAKLHGALVRLVEVLREQGGV